MIGLWIYIIGYLIGWRYLVGFFIDDLTFRGRISGETLFASIMLGSMATTIWPILLVYRVVFVLWTKYGKDLANTPTLATIFPAPKEIETKREKQNRLAREERDKQVLQREAINDREKDLGLELTKW